MTDEAGNGARERIQKSVLVILGVLLLCGLGVLALSLTTFINGRTDACVHTITVLERVILANHMPAKQRAATVVFFQQSKKEC
jgi:hypothetical protein